jgi:hypothetical protein
MEHTDTFRRLLGHNLDRLSCEERQAVAHCLSSKVVVTAEHVDISDVPRLTKPLRSLIVQGACPRGHQDMFTGGVWHTSTAFLRR